MLEEARGRPPKGGAKKGGLKRGDRDGCLALRARASLGIAAIRTCVHCCIDKKVKYKSAVLTPKLRVCAPATGNEPVAANLKYFPRSERRSSRVREKAGLVWLLPMRSLNFCGQEEDVVVEISRLGGLLEAGMLPEWEVKERCRELVQRHEAGALVKAATCTLEGRDDTLLTLLMEACSDANLSWATLADALPLKRQTEVPLEEGSVLAGALYVNGNDGTNICVGLGCDIEGLHRGFALDVKTPGCYEVAISTTHPTEVVYHPSGRVLQRPLPGLPCRAAMPSGTSFRRHRGDAEESMLAKKMMQLPDGEQFVDVDLEFRGGLGTGSECLSTVADGLYKRSTRTLQLFVEITPSDIMSLWWFRAALQSSQKSLLQPLEDHAFLMRIEVQHGHSSTPSTWQLLAHPCCEECDGTCRRAAAVLALGPLAGSLHLALGNADSSLEEQLSAAGVSPTVNSTNRRSRPAKQRGSTSLRHKVSRRQVVGIGTVVSDVARPSHMHGKGQQQPQKETKRERRKRRWQERQEQQA